MGIEEIQPNSDGSSTSLNSMEFVNMKAKKKAPKMGMSYHHEP
eukprot:CAMPEP_0117427882 /NCGR_PEP_ID=MMETSP0758-20121206/7676_1 /TAXON_ID=63605 /ORGANISM="Percolomonas cosmopolitus, Strain AE-1 (ATCC 50343)" /LENGTH=42 /DNA_ID= /DNA_START= /DNA_END= /DNA_ORIENTATION=